MKQKRRADTAWGKNRRGGRTQLGEKWKKQAGVEGLAVLLAFLLGFMFPAIPVHAAAGIVYSCTINRCYAHPVTGLIEDSGGQASYATGQGMAEGAVSSVGMMEVTDGGAYYLTFRASLMDYTSGHSFSVQNVGDSGWSAVTPTVTANGSDSNGTTSDLCIQVPSENCVVRSSMYVTPMGRDVVFYFYPNQYTEGNTTGMAATVVTENPGSEAAAGQPGAGGASQAGTDGTSQSGTDGNGQAGTDGTSQSGTDGNGQAGTDGTSQADAGNGHASADGRGRTDTEETGQIDTYGTKQPGADGISGAAGSGVDSQITNSMDQDGVLAAGASDAALDSAQGLSLSTAEDVRESAENGGSGVGTDRNTGITVTSLIVAVAVSITISGLILMAAAAAIVCYFRKNWKRWGGYDGEE